MNKVTKYALRTVLATVLELFLEYEGKRCGRALLHTVRTMRFRDTKQIN